jgi:ABC-2 type transport system permease protein
MSKLLIGCLLALVLGFSGVLFLNYQSVLNVYSDYKWSLNNALEQGANVQEELENEFSIEVFQDGLFSSSGTIDNPLAYYFDLTKKLTFAASPKYTLSQMLEFSFMIALPLLLGLIGLILGACDYSNKTIKIKGVRFSLVNRFLAKQMTLFLSTLFVFALALVVSMILGRLMFAQLGQVIELHEYLSSLPVKNIFLQLLFAYAIGFVFAEIGYTFGLAFKRTSVGIAAIFVYIYIVPNLGKFDLKNSIQYMGSLVYNFYGVVSIGEYTASTTTTSSMLVIAGIFMLSVIVGFFIMRNRSNYI